MSRRLPPASAALCLLVSSEPEAQTGARLRTREGPTVVRLRHATVVGHVRCETTGWDRQMLASSGRARQHTCTRQGSHGRSRTGEEGGLQHSNRGSKQETRLRPRWGGEALDRGEGESGPLSIRQACSGGAYKTPGRPLSCCNGDEHTAWAGWARANILLGPRRASGGQPGLRVSGSPCRTGLPGRHTLPGSAVLAGQQSRCDNPASGALAFR